MYAPPPDAYREVELDLERKGFRFADVRVFIAARLLAIWRLKNILPPRKSSNEQQMGRSQISHSMSMVDAGGKTTAPTFRKRVLAKARSRVAIKPKKTIEEELPTPVSVEKFDSIGYGVGSGPSRNKNVTVNINLVKSQGSVESPSSVSSEKMRKESKQGRYSLEDGDRSIGSLPAPGPMNVPVPPSQTQTSKDTLGLPLDDDTIFQESNNPRYMKKLAKKASKNQVGADGAEVGGAATKNKRKMVRSPLPPGM